VTGLFSAMGILVQYPVLAAIVGALLVLIGRRAHRRIVSGIGFVWLIYAAYETGIQQRWLCSGECDIRIDLLVIFPLLLISLIVAAMSLFVPRRRQK
jgi:hypothetical protein